MKSRLCRICEKIKPINNFYKNRKSYVSYCKLCYSLYGANRYRKNLVKNRKYEKAYRVIHREEIATKRRQRRYGLSEKEFNDLVSLQNGLCANQGCRIKLTSSGSSRLHIDHDHVSKKVRGLLCNNCNTALGLLHENKDKLLGLASYLT